MLLDDPLELVVTVEDRCTVALRVEASRSASKVGWPVLLEGVLVETEGVLVRSDRAELVV